MNGPSIYVETLIRAPMSALLTHTQQPDLHERRGSGRGPRFRPVCRPARREWPSRTGW